MYPTHNTLPALPCTVNAFGHTYVELSYAKMPTGTYFLTARREDTGREVKAAGINRLARLLGVPAKLYLRERQEQ